MAHEARAELAEARNAEMSARNEQLEAEKERRDYENKILAAGPEAAAAAGRVGGVDRRVAIQPRASEMSGRAA